MKIFDAQIRSDTRTEDELRNLEYFETCGVVTSAHDAHDFERADDLIAYLEGLATNEIARLNRCGLDAYAALGVLPTGRPRRAHYEVWRELPFLLQDRSVVAVGEIGAWEDVADQWELFERQVKIAVEAELPVVVTPPSELRVNMTYKMMDRLQRCGLEPPRCLMNHLDERLLSTVVSEGFRGGVAVGYRQLEPRTAARFIADVVEADVDALNRVVLCSSLRRGAADILGIPKTVVALGEAGVADEVIGRVARVNAQEFYGLTRSD